MSEPHEIAELSSAFAPCDTTEALAALLWKAICDKNDLTREIDNLYQIVQHRMEIDGQGTVEGDHPPLRLETHGEWDTTKKQIVPVRKLRFDRKGSKAVKPQ